MWTRLSNTSLFYSSCLVSKIHLQYIFTSSSIPLIQFIECRYTNNLHNFHRWIGLILTQSQFLTLIRIQISFTFLLTHSLRRISSHTFQPYNFLYCNSCSPSLCHCTIGPHCTAQWFIYCEQISDICNSIYISTIYLYRTYSKFSCHKISVPLFYRYQKSP